MDARVGEDMSKARHTSKAGKKYRCFPEPNQLVCYFEADNGVVYIIGHGFWNDAVVDEHFLELRHTAALARRNVAAVRVLVDLRDASVQSPAVAARIETETRLIWTEADRIAIILQSTLAKMQINRVVDSGNHASFIDIEDARQWLGLTPCPTTSEAAPRT